MNDRADETEEAERSDAGSAFGPPEESSVLEAPVRMLRWAWVLVWTRRGIKGVVGLIVLLFVVVFGYSQSDDFQRRVKSALEITASELLCEDVTVGRVNLSVWPPGATALDLQVTHHHTGETILSASRLRAPVRVGLTSGVGLGRLLVEGLRVGLHLDDKGRLQEFSSCETPRPKGRPLKRLPFSGLQVSDAALRVDHPEGFLSIDGLQVVPKARGLADVRADLAYQVRGVDGSTHLEWPGARIGGEHIRLPRFAIDLPMLSLGGSLGWEAGRFDTDLTARLQLEELQPWIEAPREVEGAVDIDVRLEGEANDPQLTLVSAVDDLEVQLAGVLRPIVRHRIGDVRVVAMAKRDGVRVEEVIWERGEGWIKAWATITPDGGVQDGHAIGERMQLADLLVDFDSAPTPWVDMSMDAEIAFGGTLQPLRLEGPFDFGVGDLVVGDRPIADPAVERLLTIPYAHARGTIVFEPKQVTLIAPTV
ncbi:MAG: hypothetical protein AAF602_33020, partial [Myxococcota bacterium]